MAKEKTKTAKIRLKLSPRSKDRRFLMPVIAVALFSLAGAYMLHPSRAAGSFVLKATPDFGMCVTLTFSTQYHMFAAYDTAGPQPEAPYKVEWRLTGSDGVVGLRQRPSSGSTSGGASGASQSISGTLMSSTNNGTPQVKEDIYISIFFANATDGGVTTMDAVAYGRSGKQLAKITTTDKWYKEPPPPGACDNTSPGDEDGESNGGHGSGNNGNGTADEGNGGVRQDSINPSSNPDGVRQDPLTPGSNINQEVTKTTANSQRPKPGIFDSPQTLGEAITRTASTVKEKATESWPRTLAIVAVIAVLFVGIHYWRKKLTQP